MCVSCGFTAYLKHIKESNSSLKTIPLSRIARKAMAGVPLPISRINETPHLVERPLKRLSLVSSCQTKKTAYEDIPRHVALYRE